MKPIFVTGTGTDVGKTVASAVLCAGLGAKYWKPVQAGAPGDRSLIETCLGPGSTFPEAYALARAASPHQAAAEEGIEIHPQAMSLPTLHERLVIEGAGGALVPLGNGKQLVHLIQQWQALTVIVARPDLGTINHTLLTVEALRRRNIDIGGVLFSGIAPTPTMQAIAEYGAVPILGCLPLFESFSLPSLRAAFARLRAFSE